VDTSCARFFGFFSAVTVDASGADRFSGRIPVTYCGIRSIVGSEFELTNINGDTVIDD
jgi:hypothetical protein